MLSLYDQIVVPGVNHVVLYRDDERPHRFYMVTDQASIVREADNSPMFTFILYARNVDTLGETDREVERGYVAMSTQVAVSPADQEKIRTYLRGRLSDEVGRGFRFLGTLIASPEPELAYPPVWIDGSVELATVPTDMAPFSAGSKAPSLVGANVAVFAQNLTQDGAELMRQSLLHSRMPAIVNYTLRYAARIPSIKIHIHGDKSAFYEEIKRHYEYVSWKKTDVDYWFYSYQTYEEIRRTVDTIDSWDSTFHSLTVTVDDTNFTDPASGGDLKQKLIDMAFEVLKNSVLPSFFEDKWAPSEDEKKTGFTRNSSGTVDITFEQSAVIPKQINPSALLTQALTQDDITKNTVWVDLSELAFPELDVTVNANVNFAADPIYALKVFLAYDQADEIRNVRVKKSKELLFRSADTPGRWRMTMAKSADGAPKDTYGYWSELTYKETGQTIRIPATGMTATQERQLVISYRRLGFVKVDILLGSLPPTVESVDVTIRYPGSTASDATQAFNLSKDKPTAAYFTHTGSDGEPDPYRYTLAYNLKGGQRMDLPEASSTGATLTIRNPFDLSAVTHFVAQGDFTQTAKIVLDAHYEDAANDFRDDFHAELAASGAGADWTLPLRDPSKRRFTFNATVLQKDGSRIDLPLASDDVGKTIFLGTGGVAPLDIKIVNTVDWTKYKVAVVSLKYDDDAHGLHQAKEFVLRDGNPATDPEWLVLVQDPTQNRFSYRIRLVGENAADSRQGDWVQSSDTVVIVE
jgi:hypothetical protein